MLRFVYLDIDSASRLARTTLSGRVADVVRDVHQRSSRATVTHLFPLGGSAVRP